MLGGLVNARHLSYGLALPGVIGSGWRLENERAVAHSHQSGPTRVTINCDLAPEVGSDTCGPASAVSVCGKLTLV